MPVRRSTHVRAPKPVPLSRAARIVVPVAADVALPAGHDARAGVGFLRVNRRRLAVLAAAISFITVILHDPPASAAALAAPTPSIGQTLTTAEVEPPLDPRDAIDVVNYTPVQWPIPPNSGVNSDFGPRISPCSGCSSDHRGVDFGPGAGSPIAAIADGVVTVARSDPGGLGVHVIVRHTINGAVVDSVYGHMRSGSTTVAVGDSVTRGEVLGLVGSTGASTGDHLHLEIRPDGGTAVEPISWLAQNVTEPYVAPTR